MRITRLHLKSKWKINKIVLQANSISSYSEALSIKPFFTDTHLLNQMANKHMQKAMDEEK